MVSKMEPRLRTWVPFIVPRCISSQYLFLEKFKDIADYVRESLNNILGNWEVVLHLDGVVSASLLWSAHKEAELQILIEEMIQVSTFVFPQF